MKKWLFLLPAIACVVPYAITAYAETDQKAFKTRVVKKGETLWTIARKHWKTVAKINRISPERLREGMPLRIPRDFAAAEENAPVPRELPGLTGKLILIDLAKQAFGAYENGKLRMWGPISSSAKKSNVARRMKKNADALRRPETFRYWKKTAIMFQANILRQTAARSWNMP